MQKVIAKIHLGNIRKNAEQFSALTQKRICAVVKANAYGHGAEEVVNALESTVDCFAVALISEGVDIRTCACGKDILVFTPPLNEREGIAIIQNGFLATIPDLWTARLIAGIAQRLHIPARVHLKMNTGMNRYGMNLSMLGKVCKFLQGNEWVRVEGIYSHLYEYTLVRAQEQNALFVKAVAVCKRYYPNVITHLGGTYGALISQYLDVDMLRVGIGLYGYIPDGVEENFADEIARLNLQKGMEVHTMVALNRKISYGGVGYGRAWTDEKIKTKKRVYACRFGYADGFLRQKRNGVVDCEKNANHLCMDVCLKIGNKRRGEKQAIMTDASEIAKACGTITHEVLCAATRRAEFVYDNE